MKILYFGDIVGKVGRRGITKVLPELRKKYQPDFVIANAENMAHGTGITPSTMKEMEGAGVDFFTSGNDVFHKPSGLEILAEIPPRILRPHNFPDSKPGTGVKEIDVDGKKLLVINIQGQVFMKDEVENPFLTIDKLLLQYAPKNYEAIFVDFHAEATSEMIAMGWHLDGRASAVVGTHTHVPTADGRILPDGTAYITDVGMNGSKDSIIGASKDAALKRFLGDGGRLEYDESGLCSINAIILETDERKASSFEQIQMTVEV
jgi:2',3'-cyclic-nucleotide 2'-phosphodiesterase